MALWRGSDPAALHAALQAHAAAGHLDAWIDAEPRRRGFTTMPVPRRARRTTRRRRRRSGFVRTTTQRRTAGRDGFTDGAGHVGLQAAAWPVPAGTMLAFATGHPASARLILDVERDHWGRPRVLLGGRRDVDAWFERLLAAGWDPVLRRRADDLLSSERSWGAAPTTTAAWRSDRTAATPLSWWSAAHDAAGRGHDGAVTPIARFHVGPWGGEGVGTLIVHRPLTSDVGDLTDAAIAPTPAFAPTPAHAAPAPHAAAATSEVSDPTAVPLVDQDAAPVGNDLVETLELAEEAVDLAAAPLIPLESTSDALEAIGDLALGAVSPDTPLPPDDFDRPDRADGTAEDASAAIPLADSDPSAGTAPDAPAESVDDTDPIALAPAAEDTTPAPSWDEDAEPAPVTVRDEHDDAPASLDAADEIASDDVVAFGSYAEVDDAHPAAGDPAPTAPDNRLQFRPIASASGWQPESAPAPRRPSRWVVPAVPPRDVRAA